MAWYDTFSNFYDTSLEKLYWDSRVSTVSLLDLQPDQTVLDLGCGTGANLPHLFERQDGLRVIGVDASAGMLSKAKHRADENGWTTVDFLETDVRNISGEPLFETGTAKFDHIICTLGFSVFPEWERVLGSAAELLAPSGQIAIMDVFADKRTVHTWLVEKIAGADVSRDIPGAVKNMFDDYRYLKMPVKESKVGGTLYAITGTRRARS